MRVPRPTRAHTYTRRDLGPPSPFRPHRGPCVDCAPEPSPLPSHGSSCLRRRPPRLREDRKDRLILLGGGPTTPRHGQPMEMVRTGTDTHGCAAGGRTTDTRRGASHHPVSTRRWGCIRFGRPALGTRTHRDRPRFERTRAQVSPRRASLRIGKDTLVRLGRDGQVGREGSVLEDALHIVRLAGNHPRHPCMFGTCSSSEYIS